MFEFLRHALLIRLSGLFDRDYYLKSYQDVRDSGINPLVHFMKFGWREGRNPSSLFNLEYYLELHPDLATANINPLVHFIRTKVKNGSKLRSISADMIGYDYIDLSSDVVKKLLVENEPTSLQKTTDIVIFPIIDWDFRFQRPQQIARQLEKLGHRIFYINTGHEDHQGNMPLIRRLHHNIYEVKLVGGHQKITLESSLSDLDVDQLEKSIGVFKNYLLLGSVIMMVDAPYWTRLVLRLKEQYGWHLVFDCMDLFTDFLSDSLADFTDEERLLKQSDLVLTTSQQLYDHSKSYNENTILVPNAADFEFFHQAKEPLECVDMEHLSPPIIGYYGAVANWFDSELVGQLASKHPEWTFYIVGHTHLADLSPFDNLANVHILGERPYKQLIGYLSHFDVCIIPFKKMPLTQAANPVKLFEYLSAGKPVVVSRLDEITKYSDWVALADTLQEWETAIQASLTEEKTPELLTKRFDFAKANTWEKRVQKIEKALNQL